MYVSPRNEQMICVRRFYWLISRCEKIIVKSFCLSIFLLLVLNIAEIAKSNCDILNHLSLQLQRNAIALPLISVTRCLCVSAVTSLTFVVVVVFHLIFYFYLTVSVSDEVKMPEIK